MQWTKTSSRRSRTARPAPPASIDSSAARPELLGSSSTSQATMQMARRRSR
jgi:hypothetical protein